MIKTVNHKKAWEKLYKYLEDHLRHLEEVEIGSRPILDICGPGMKKKMDEILKQYTREEE